AHEYTQMAISEVDRIGYIARQALGFYREAAAPVDVSVADLVESIVRLYAAGAQNKGVHIETQIETQVTVPAFPGEMRQVFSNLIVNAVDAVPRGGMIKIRVKHGRNWGSRNMGLRVLVSDNGPGIPAATRPHIFVRYALKCPEFIEQIVYGRTLLAAKHAVCGSFSKGFLLNRRITKRD